MKYLKRFNESIEVMDFDKMYKTTTEKIYNEIGKEFKGRFFPLKVVLDELNGNYNMSICLAVGWMDRLSENEEDWLEELIDTTQEEFSEYKNIYIGYLGDTFSKKRIVFERQNDAFPKKSDDYMEFPKPPNPGRGDD
jgi:hypothetical protein